MDIGSRIGFGLAVLGLLLGMRAIGRAAPSVFKYGLDNQSKVEAGLGLLKRLFRK
ncbi:MAG: hypothetical protein IT450_08325 [Phycisphaerales bacterium]|nr:hypothetical protein [Phycisphaerales bacterium]